MTSTSTHSFALLETQGLHIIDKLEFDWDEDDDVTVLSPPVSKSKHTIILVGKHYTSTGRVVAGHKRAMNAQFNVQAAAMTGAGQVMQSITATPALCHSSFEELRLECYLQSAIAKGAPPTPVDAVATPWAVIQPVFKAFTTVAEPEPSCEVAMSDSF